MSSFIFKRAVSLNTGTSGPMISHHGGSVRASKEHDDDSYFMSHKPLLFRLLGILPMVLIKLLING